MSSFRKPNLILIVLDAMRLDRSIRLKDALNEFIWYDNAISTAPWTLPSHVSMFTGLYPSQHGSHESENVKCTDIGRIRNTSAALIGNLKELGYTTYGFSGNILVSPTYGFNFDVFNSPSFSFPWPLVLDELPPRLAELFRKYLDTKHLTDEMKFGFNLLVENPKLAISVTGLFLRHMAAKLGSRWPREKGGKVAVQFVRKEVFRQPFFLFMNLLETHEPYSRPDDLLKGFTPRPLQSVESSRIAKWVAGYDSQVDVVNKLLIELLSAMMKRNLLENTIIIVTSDHGQLLGEHGWIGHGSLMYDELMRVPLAIRYPDRTKVVRVRPHGVISLANLYPFIMELAQGEESDSSLYSDEAFGESWGLYENVPLNKFPLLSQAGARVNGRRICVYTNHIKITYNVASHSVEERYGVAAGSPKEVELIERCRRFLDSKPIHTETSDELQDDETVLARLRMLGYV